MQPRHLAARPQVSRRIPALRVPALLVPVLLVAALLAATPVSAQMDFDETQQVRIGYGDIPTTDAVERTGAWNFQDTRRVMMEEGPVTLVVPTAAVFEGIACGCNHTVTGDGDRFTVDFDAGATGEASLTFAYWFGGNDGRLAANLVLTDDAAVILWVAEGTTVGASASVPAPLPSTAQNPGYEIYYFEDAGPGAFFVTAGVGGDAPPASGSFGLDWVTMILGLIAGAGLWALLVSQGVVQKRSRKQVAGSAAHRDAAGRESKEVLEGRKRALMAGLKELELAKQAQDIDTPTYDALKAEWKKQTVTVMRALEEASKA